jgi:hypothetical protein
MKLPPARLFIALTLLGADVVARAQVDISANLSLIGVRYRVESSVDLRAWATNNGANGQIASNLQSSFTDTNKADLKFYRVHLLP